MTTAVDRISYPIVSAAPVQGDDAIARSSVLDRLILNGKKFTAELHNAVQDVRLLQTIEGASTLTISVFDDKMEFLNSPILHANATLEIDEYKFALIQVSYSGMVTTLTFEDYEVNTLRKFKKPRKFSRSKYTRAQAARAMVKEAKSVEFFSPEINVRQPIAGSNDRIADKERQANRDPGFARNEKFTVKGKQADRSQRRNLERALDVGYSRDMPRRVMLSLIMAIIQESTARNLPGGDRDSVGILQQRASWGSRKNRMNIEWAVGRYLNGAIQEYRANSSIGPGALAQAVQKSAHPDAYDQWRSEANKILAAYYDDDASASTSTADRTRNTKKFEFTRGAPGGSRGEDTWTCLNRLAEEVQWRCFMFKRRVMFASEPYLFRSAPVAVIDKDTDGVQSISFDWDVGQKVAEASVIANINRWNAVPGSTIKLDKVGPATGRWLIAEIEGSLFSVNRTVTVRKPRPKLPEPAGEAVSTGSQSGESTTEGGLPSAIQRAYDKAKSIHKKRYPYVWGGGHSSFAGPYDCSGAVSAVLHAAGKLDRPQTTAGLKSFGVAGQGKYMTIWVKHDGSNNDHVWIEFKVDGAEHFGTGRWGTNTAGAGFKPRMHSKTGFTARRIPGL